MTKWKQKIKTRHENKVGNENRELKNLQKEIIHEKYEMKTAQKTNKKWKQNKIKIYIHKKVKMQKNNRTIWKHGTKQTQGITIYEIKTSNKTYTNTIQKLIKTKYNYKNARTSLKWKHSRIFLTKWKRCTILWKERFKSYMKPIRN